MPSSSKERLSMATVTQIQETILDCLGFDAPIETACVCNNPLWEKFRNCSLTCAELALGKVGIAFKEFVDCIDPTHPGVQRFFDDLNVDDFTAEVSELLDLGAFAEANKLTRVLPLIGYKILNRHNRNFFKTAGNPFNNQCHVRFISRREDRDAIRTAKKVQPIDLVAITNRGISLWETQPEDFSSFIRNNLAYVNELEEARKKAQRYLSLGCTGLAKNIEESVDYFEKQIQEVYYGFNRLMMTNAAIILAKAMDCLLDSSLSQGGKKNYRIFIKRSHLTDCHFGSSDVLEYRPRAYPLHAMRHVPENVRKIIDHLEAFPAACGKPIFDNFVVIVPGVFYPQGTCFRDLAGVDRNFSSQEEANQAFDEELIKAHYIYPVLLGERDGRCFFISYWL